MAGKTNPKGEFAGHLYIRGLPRTVKDMFKRYAVRRRKTMTTLMTNYIIECCRADMDMLDMKEKEKLLKGIDKVINDREKGKRK